MIDLPVTVYLWVKAAHVIAVIAWMAGLLYLPRLFVYHADVDPGGRRSQTFTVMERRLMHVIMNPAMMASLILGLILLLNLDPGAWLSGWFVGKILAVAGLLAVHVAMGRWRRDFAANENVRSQKFFRFMNEVPTVLMIAAVIFIVVKPF